MLKHSLYKRTEAGFTLLELSIVMLIIGILLSGVFISLSSTIENANRSNTRVLITQVNEALYGYAQVHGRLPCPTSPTALPASAGFESPLTGGVCTHYHGYVPSATLGIFGKVNENGFLVDAWHNPLRYSVMDMSASLTNGGFTSVIDMQTLYNTPATPPLLLICDNAACNNIITSNTAPAVVLSMGKNWANYSSTAEQSNEKANSPSPTNNIFVSIDYSEENYDDLIEALSPQILFTRMIQAGKLP